MEVFKSPEVIAVIVAAILGAIGFIFRKNIFPEKESKSTKAKADNAAQALAGDGTNTLHKDSHNTTIVGVPHEYHDATVKEVAKLEVKLEFTQQQLNEVRQDLSLSEEKIAEITSQLEKEREKSSLDETIKLQLKEYDEQGEFEKAEELVEEELVDKKKMELAAAYFQQAGYAMLQLKYEKAKILYEAALELHPEDSSYLSSAGYINNILGNYTIAKEYDEKALDIALEKYGDNNLTVSVLYSNLADSYGLLGDYNRAKEYAEKALNIELNIRKENHEEIAIRYNVLGLILTETREYDYAIECQENALKITQSVFGENHEKVATRYNNIGAIYLNLFKYEKATSYFKKALDIHLSAGKSFHPDTAFVYNNLAYTYLLTHEYQDALNLFEKSKIIFSAFLGEDHHHTINVNTTIRTLEEQISKQ